MIDTQKIRRFIIIGTILVVILLSGWYGVTHGRVTVSAPGATQITIRQNIDRSKDVVDTNSSQLDHTLQTGSYIVRATNNEGSVEKVVDIKPFRNEIVSLTIPKKQLFNTVSNGALHSVHTMKSGYTYYVITSGSSSQLWRESAEVSPERVFLYGENVYSIVWSGDYGLGIKHTNNVPTLFVVHNGNISQIASPKIDNSASIAVDERREAWWVLSDSTLFSLNNRGGVLNSISSDISSNESSLIAATKGYVATAISDSETLSQEISILSTTSGKKTSSIPSVATYGTDSGSDFFWSPDGSKFLLVTNRSLSIYYNNRAESVDTAVPAGVTSAIWKDESTILYGAANNLWEYNISTRTSRLVSSLATYYSVIGLERDNSQYLMSASYSSGNLLFRTSDTEDSDISARLGESNIHQLTAGCSIFFTHFTKPYIHLVVQGDASEICQQEAEAYLESISVDPTAIQFSASYE